MEWSCEAGTSVALAQRGDASTEDKQRRVSSSNCLRMRRTMKRTRPPVPSFKGLTPASETSSRCKRMNRGAETRHERLLRSLLWRQGFRFRKNDKALVGRPDIVFPKHRVAVFCDGDFWHGRQWRRLSGKLRVGSNASYWAPKIRTNILRDRRHNGALARAGWHVVRLWETDILNDPQGCTAQVVAALERWRPGRNS